MIYFVWCGGSVVSGGYVVARTMKLTRSGVGKMGRWITREGAAERFEVAAQGTPTSGSTSDEFMKWDEDGVEDWAEEYGSSLDRPSIPMEWVGDGSEALGLTGEADIKAVARILQHGTGPHGEPLRTGTAADEDHHRVCAFGIVFSAPKTVSALMASPNPDVREAVQQAFRAASDRYIQTLEAHLTVRRGKAGIRSERITGLIAVRALHQTTSAGDPHLHAHYMVAASAASAVDGSYRALDGRVLFQAQKLAEAAANWVLRERLDQDLHIEGWTLQEAGSVPVWEVTGLRDAVPDLSLARKHMQEISEKLGVPFALRSRKMDANLWRRHREQKAKIAEKLEHRMDEALHRGGDAAAFIRGHWQQTIESTHCGTALSVMALRKKAEARPKDRAAVDFSDLQAEIEAPTPDALATAQACIRRNPGGLDALKEARDALSVSRPARIFSAVRWWATRNREEKYRVLKAEIATLTQSLEVVEREHRARDVRTARDHAHQLLRDLTATLGTFTPSDIAARLMVTEGLDPSRAQRDAARLLRHWVSNGDVHPGAGLDLETVCQVLEAGGFSAVTADNHQLSRSRSLIPDDLVKQELALAKVARALSAEQRTRLIVPIPETFTSEQTQAAACIAQGRALSVTVGVAGSGKTFLAKPIVAAAQRQGLTVRVLARNRVLADTLKEDLGCNDAQVFATFDADSGKSQKTLLIVDEAGLADRADLQAVLDAVARNPNWQVWLIGDRAQAQPIDRLGSFAVVEQNVEAGAMTRLNTSYRCAAWSQEHQLLRDLPSDPVNLAERIVERVRQDGRLVAVSPESGEDRHAQLADLLIRYRNAGEDALAITRDNASSAVVSEYIQAHRGISVDLNTELRFGQHAGVGDQVRTRLNDGQLGVRNGDLWTVRAVNGAGTVTLQSVKNPHRSVHLPKDYTRDALELAYATTADAAQGITVDRAIVDATGMGRSLYYSAATRGRQGPVVLVQSSADQAGNALAQVLAVDDVAKTMAELLGQQRQRAMDLEYRQDSAVNLGTAERRELAAFRDQAERCPDIKNALEQGKARAQKENQAEQARIERERQQWDRALMREGFTLQVGKDAASGKGYHLRILDPSRVVAAADMMMYRYKAAMSIAVHASDDPWTFMAGRIPPITVTFGPELSVDQKVSILRELRDHGCPISVDTQARLQTELQREAAERRVQAEARRLASERAEAARIFASISKSLEQDGLAGITQRLHKAGMTQDNQGRYGHPHQDLPEFAQVFSAIDRAVQDFRIRAEQIHFQRIYEREKPGWKTRIIGLEKYQNELRAEPWLQAMDAEALQAATQRFRQEVASQQQPRPAQPYARPESPQPRNPRSSRPR
jgi:conjugative relaxase-like TrwC/TraI family protein